MLVWILDEGPVIPVFYRLGSETGVFLCISCAIRRVLPFAETVVFLVVTNFTGFLYHRKTGGFLCISSKVSCCRPHPWFSCCIALCDNPSWSLYFLHGLQQLQLLQLLSADFAHHLGITVRAESVSVGQHPDSDEKGTRAVVGCFKGPAALVDFEWPPQS